MIKYFHICFVNCLVFYYIKNHYFTYDHLHGKEHHTDFEFVDVALRVK